MDALRTFQYIQQECYENSSSYIHQECHENSSSLMTQNRFREELQFEAVTLFRFREE
jgi:hypothetical protein